MIGNVAGVSHQQMGAHGSAFATHVPWLQLHRRAFVGGLLLKQLNICTYDLGYAFDSGTDVAAWYQRDHT